MRPVLRLRELDPWRSEPMSDVRARDLIASAVVDVRPGARGGWEIRPGRWVGAARVGDTEIHIDPKIPISRLLFLLGYLTNPKAWHDQPVSFDTADDLAAAAAEALSRQVDVALRRGILQGYVAVEEALPTIRGRIREADQLRRRYGSALPVEIRYDDYTVDITENRILRTAVDRMLGVAGIGDTARHRLARARHRLAEVTPLTPGAPIPSWRASRLNARYVPALRLAELVLDATSWDMGTGTVPVTGFLVNMPKVFEAFVCTALSEVIRAGGGVPRMQDGSRALDDDGTVELIPDLVWYDPGRGPAGGRRRQVQGREVRRLPEPGHLPDTGLLHRVRASSRASRVREGQRGAENVPDQPGRRRGGRALPRPGGKSRGDTRPDCGPGRCDRGPPWARTPATTCGECATRHKALVTK